MPNLLRVILALLTLAAIGLQLSLHIAASFSAVNFFSYFTNLSNLVANIVLLISAFATSARTPARIDALRFASTVNMLIVGIVFALLLRDADLGALLPWINALLHYVMPVAVVLDWIRKPPVTSIGASQLALALVFPVAYLAYTVLRGSAIGWYPYPFLNPAVVGGATGVAMYALGIAIAFVFAGLALLVIGNRRRVGIARSDAAR